jgi:hypothetical protein
VDIRKIVEVAGSLWCTPGFGSSPGGSDGSSSSATNGMGLRCRKAMRWQVDGARALRDEEKVRARPRVDTRGFRPALITYGINDSMVPDQIKVSVFLSLTPSLDASFTRNSNGQAVAHGWCTGRRDRAMGMGRAARSCTMSTGCRTRLIGR